MTKKLDRDLIEHARKQLGEAARRHVRDGMDLEGAARAAIRETQSLFPFGWKLGVQGDDSDEVVEVWEVEHKYGAPIARLSRESEPVKKPTALAAGPAVTISVHEDADEETGEESYTISDDGGEFDDVEEDSAPDVQGDIDERRGHYRALGRRVVLDVPGGRGWR